MTDGYLKPRDTYSDDVLTEKRKKVKTTNLWLCFLFTTASKLQHEEPLRQEKWDDYLIWASLLEISNRFYEQMVQVDAFFLRKQILHL